MFSTHLMPFNIKKLILTPLLATAIVLPFTLEKTNIDGALKTVTTYEHQLMVQESSEDFDSQASQIPENFIRGADTANAEVAFNDDNETVGEELPTTALDSSSTIDIDDEENAGAAVIPPEATLMEKQVLSQDSGYDDPESVAVSNIAPEQTTLVTHILDKSSKFGEGLTVSPIIIDAVFVEESDDIKTDEVGSVQFDTTPPKTSVKPESIITAQSSDLLKANEKLFALQVTQNKKQTLKSALAPIKLSATQHKIISTGKFTRSALSARQLTLYFTGDPKHKLLRGLHIARGSNRVSYVVSKQRGQYVLKNLKVVDADQRALIEKRFKSANLRRLGTQAQVASGGKKTRRRSRAVDNGRYRALHVTQKKGQSLSSALQALSLSSLQKRLINALPINKRAKSTRYFNVLFEKQGGSKYLRAVRVTRANRVFEYVLTKYKGNWLWADSHGKVRLNSSRRRGNSKGFLRYPLNFSRISSGFNLYRRHPITGRSRPHRGTDFKAAHGTPVWAPAAGTVVFSGRQRGYGITLIIDHGNGYKTKYAHLSRIMKGARRGQRVRKRQIVARVGNTGASTGAHLHYEVLVNGRARNPLTVRLPGGGGRSRNNPSTQSKTLLSAKRDANKFLPILRRMAR